MNVYEKLNSARITLQSQKLKKSGQNKFAGYQYFELSDFLPTVQAIFAEQGLCGTVSYGKDIATLTVINTEAPEEKIEFTSPMSSAALKGCHEVQNLGAVETYIRRYLWVTAMEIVEHDALDASQPVGKGKGVIKPATGVMESLGEEEQAFLKGLAEEVTSCFNDGDVKAAVSLLEEQHLDADEKVAVWDLLPSGCRSAIKKHKEAANKQDFAAQA